MNRTRLLKQYILDSEILIMPGAHDALTAKIIEAAGFQALTMGGYAASGSLLGQPDVSLLSMTEIVDCYRRVVDAVGIPVFVDGDTGYGGVLNVRRTVKEIEGTGAAGMFIEDQVFPKRCGHMEGKQVIDAAEMEAKIKAAVDARTDTDFVIMARTDALAIHGIGHAIERANRYRTAGADLIFVEAPTSVEQMVAITKGVDAPLLANNVEGGKSPLLSATELQRIGYSAVVFPVAATFTVAAAVSRLMAHLKANGSTEGFLDSMSTFDDFNELVGLERLRVLEEKYFSDDGNLSTKTGREP